MEHRAVLEITLSSFEPQSVADLKAMGLLDTVNGSPRYRTLFVIQDNKLHVLHRSIAEASKEFGVDVRRGHATLAAYTADQVLMPWLDTVSWLDSHNDLPISPYSLRYAVDHLREAGCWDCIYEIVFRLPCLAPSCTQIPGVFDLDWITSRLIYNQTAYGSTFRCSAASIDSSSFEICIIRFRWQADSTWSTVGANEK